MKARDLFDSITMFDMLGHEIAFASAENYRVLRKQSITVRKTVEVIVGLLCS